jgi:superfamily II DNA or RNA helicase
VRLLFDQGTILLLDADSPSSLTDLPLALWDPRVKALRCPARVHHRVVTELRRRGVPFQDEVARLADAPTGLPACELRPYQEAALESWFLAGQRGVTVLPTGSGKTRVAIAAMSRLGVPTLCLVPTRVLLDQWARAIHETTGYQPGRLGDGERQIEGITVATFESGWRHMHQLGNRFSLLVVDEAHHFGCGMRDEALDMCTAPRRLGLTATPPAGRNARRLAELIGPVTYELHIDDLAGSFLAPFDSVVLHLDLTPVERAEYEPLMACFGETLRRFRAMDPGASWDDFACAAAKTEQGRRALAAWQRVRQMLAFPEAKRRMLAHLLARHADSRVIVFTADNATAYAVSREHLIMPLTCHVGRHERERALHLFREGKLRALVSAQVLNEGLDVPDAEVGIIVAGSKGMREHVQRVGRVLRPRPGKRAIVYELVVRATGEVRQARRRRNALAA